MSLEFLLLQLLNGLSFAALLFLLASGFTLIFGLMRIVNLAHGALYLVGGYVGVLVVSRSGNFGLGLLAGAATAAVIGSLSERVLLRKVRGRELPEVLLTVGLAFVISDLCLAVFGGNPKSIAPGSVFAGNLPVGPVTYPAYRLFVIAIAVAIGFALYLIQYRTRIGAVVRAGVDDREMAGAMGINVDRVFALLFAFGSALAGVAGVAAAGMSTLRPGADTDILLFALVVVIIGGLGSIQGAVIGSVLIGLLDTFSKTWFPQFSYFAVFVPMALVLVLRPQGLFRRSAAA